RAILPVVEHAGEGRVDRVDVITAVEVIIDVDLPVAFQSIVAPPGILESAAAGGDALGHRGDLIGERHSAVLDAHGEQGIPDGDVDFAQPVVFAAKVL